MFNFNFYLLMYFLKNTNLQFNLLNEEKRNILNPLLNHSGISFIFKKYLKFIHLSYLIQQAFLFVSFIMLGFFIFSSLMSIFHFDNISLGINKTWEDFISLHYVSFFIISLSLFSVFSFINALLQYKINSTIHCLKKSDFPLYNYILLFSDELDKIETTPLYDVIIDNNNLYGLLIFIIFEKHVEQEELKLIPEYFHKEW